MASNGLRETPMTASYSWTDPTQLHAAVDQNKADMLDIDNLISNAVTQGLQLYNNANTGSNQVGQTAQDLAATAGNYTAGNVDLSNYQPYMNAGALATNQLASMQGLGANPLTAQQIENQYLNTGAVQAQLNAGNNMINSNYAAKGGLGSGALLKALQTFGQGTAANTIGAAQDRLSALAGQGATAANQYAASLLNKYNIDTTAQTAANSNQNALLNTANNSYQNANQSANGQSNYLSGLYNNQAQLQAAAANNRMSALLGGALKVDQKNQWSAGILNGTVGAGNTQLNL